MVKRILKEMKIRSLHRQLRRCEKRLALYRNDPHYVVERAMEESRLLLIQMKFILLRQEHIEQLKEEIKRTNNLK